MAIDYGDEPIVSASVGAESIQRIHIGEVLLFDRSALVPTITAFRADPSTINEDQAEALPANILLSWDATNALTERVYLKDTGVFIGSESPHSTPRPLTDTTYAFIASNASGQSSQELTVLVNKLPTLSGLNVRYVQNPSGLGGATVYVSGQWTGKPKPAFSADQGIGSISDRHFAGDGSFEFSHHFAAGSGQRTIRVTGTNRVGSGHADIVVNVP